MLWFLLFERQAGTASDSLYPILFQTDFSIVLFFQINDTFSSIETMHLSSKNTKLSFYENLVEKNLVKHITYNDSELIKLNFHSLETFS